MTIPQTAQHCSSAAVRLVQSSSPSDRPKVPNVCQACIVNRPPSRSDLLLGKGLVLPNGVIACKVLFSQLIACGKTSY